MEQEDILFFVAALFVFIIVSSLIMTSETVSKTECQTDTNCLIKKIDENEENVFNADTSSWNDSCIMQQSF